MTVSPLFIVMCVAFAFFGYGIAILSYIAALLYHEYAHAVVAEKKGYVLNRFKLMPYGASLSGDFMCVRPRDEIAIAAAGPMSNFAVGIVCIAAWWMFPTVYVFTEPLVAASFSIGFINLLPMYPLDGGRILRAIMRMRFSDKNAQRIVKAVSITFGIIGFSLSVVLVLFGGNFSYLAISAFVLLSSAMPGEQIGYERLYSMAKVTERLKRGLPVREIMVSGENTLFELFKMLRGGCFTRFIIVDGDFSRAKIITETQLESKIIVVSPAEKVKTVDF